MRYRQKFFTAVGSASLLCAVLLPAVVGAAVNASMSCYVQDGLLAIYDGIENRGGGGHDPHSRMWCDLRGGWGSHHIELLDGDVVNSDNIRLARGVRTAMEPLLDAYQRMTFEFNGRPVAMDAVGDWSSLVANVPNVGYIGWQGKASGYNGLILGRPMALTGTYSDKYNARSYNSGYTQLSDIVAAGAWQTYSGSPSSGKSGGGNDPVFVNGKQVARTSLNWEGGSRTSDFTLKVGGAKTETEIRSLRLYGRQLTEDELAQNVAVDRMRFDGATSADTGYRWTDQGMQIGLIIENSYNGKVSVDSAAGVTSGLFWRTPGAEVTLTPQPGSGKVFLCWKGDTDGLTVGDGGVITLMLGRSRRLSCHFVDEASGATERTWTGTAGDGLWETSGNWSPSGTPIAGDVVTIPSGKKACVGATTPKLSFLSVAGTLAMTNWLTCLKADVVTIENGGVVQPVCAFKDNEMSNRVWIACGSMTIASGGKIEATKLGYRTQCGPCWAGASSPKTGQAASYGGAATPVGVTKTYGSIEYPSDPGSGGQGAETATWIQNGWIRYGGGAVRLEVTGSLTVNGDILARGTYSGLNCGGAGSGGAVWITCNTIEGEGRVSVRAVDNASGNEYPGAGGGRIAVHYDSAAQATRAHACSVAFDARGGAGSYYTTSGLYYDHRLDNSIRPDYIGKNGTLYFTDSQFLTNGLYLTRGWRFSGEWHSPDPLPMSLTTPGDFKFDDCNVTLPMTNVTIGGHLTVVGSSYARATKIAFTNVATFSVSGNASVKNCWLALTGGRTSVAGDFSIGSTSTDKKYTGQFNLAATPTNVTKSAFGCEFAVGGSWTVASNGYCVVACNGTDGAIPKLSAVSVVIEKTGWLSADLGGWNAKLGPGAPGNMSYPMNNGGACYGGIGSQWTAAAAETVKNLPYGDFRKPVLPGSGGKGTSGGGVVLLNAAKKLRVDGLITADGKRYLNKSEGAGSGGTVNISCKHLVPSVGSITANGGWGGNFSGVNCSAGGGGRVALRLESGVTNGLTMTATGPAFSGTLPANWTQATDGTVFVKRIGGLMITVK